MKLFKLGLVSDPSFNTVINLSNTVFDPDNVRSGHMATEAQIDQLYERIRQLELRREECCSPLIFWEARVQIVRMTTLNFRNDNALLGGGTVISTFDENISVGKMRRGTNYTVTFPLKWDDNLYVKRNVAANGRSGDYACNVSSTPAPQYTTYLNYRLVEDSRLDTSQCIANQYNYNNFWYNWGIDLALDTNHSNPQGYIINPSNNWGNFVYNVTSDGTVTITDTRRNENFNIIRYYTQWILRQTADGQTIPDP